MKHKKKKNDLQIILIGYNINFAFGSNANISTKIKMNDEQQRKLNSSNVNSILRLFLILFLSFVHSVSGIDKINRKR